MICPRCGKTISDSRFCPECGAPLKAVAIPNSRTQIAPPEAHPQRERSFAPPSQPTVAYVHTEEVMEAEFRVIPDLGGRQIPSDAGLLIIRANENLRERLLDVWSYEFKETDYQLSSPRVWHSLFEGWDLFRRSSYHQDYRKRFRVKEQRFGQDLILGVVIPVPAGLYYAQLNPDDVSRHRATVTSERVMVEAGEVTEIRDFLYVRY
jgi:hypothetical protein